MAHISNACFYQPTCLSPIYKPKPLLLPSNPLQEWFSSLLCPLTLCFKFSSLFLEALHLQQPSLTFKDPAYPTGNRALLFYLVFSLLWMPKGAHPHLCELFLHPTSIWSTSTSLNQPNLHPFCMLSRSVMPLISFPIHLDPRFLILEPLIILMVIRIFFFLLL